MHAAILAAQPLGQCRKVEPGTMLALQAVAVSSKAVATVDHRAERVDHKRIDRGHRSGRFITPDRAPVCFHFDQPPYADVGALRGRRIIQADLKELAGSAIFAFPYALVQQEDRAIAKHLNEIVRNIITGTTASDAHQEVTPIAQHHSQRFSARSVSLRHENELGTNACDGKGNARLNELEDDYIEESLQRNAKRTRCSSMILLSTNELNKCSISAIATS